MPKVVTIDTAEGLREITLKDDADVATTVRTLFDRGVLKRKADQQAKVDSFAGAGRPTAAQAAMSRAGGEGFLGIEGSVSPSRLLTGAAKTIADAPLVAGQAVNAIPLNISKAYDVMAGKPSDATRFFQQRAQSIEEAKGIANRWIDGLTNAPGVNIRIGKLKIPVEETIGGMAPFAVGGWLKAGQLAAKAGVETSTFMEVVKSMGEAAKFTAAYEAPNIASAASWDDAKNRALQAGINIPLSAVMAGAFTGGSKSLKWAREALGEKNGVKDLTAEATAQTIVEENGVPNKADLGGEKPTTNVVDDIHAQEFKKKVESKKKRLQNAISKTDYSDVDRAAIEEARRVLGVSDGVSFDAIKSKATEMLGKVEKGSPDYQRIKAAKQTLLAAEMERPTPDVSREELILDREMLERRGDAPGGSPEIDDLTKQIEAKSEPAIEVQSVPEWSKVTETLQKMMDSRDYREWFRELEPKREGGKLVLVARNKAHIDQIKAEFSDQLRAALKYAGIKEEVVFRTIDSDINRGLKDLKEFGDSLEEEIVGPSAKPPTKEPPSGGTPTPPPETGKTGAGGPPKPPKDQPFTQFEKAIRDFEERAKLIEKLNHEAVREAEIAAIRDPIVHKDHMTATLARKQFFESVKGWLADVQRIYSPISRLKGWVERVPFIHYDSEARKFETFILPKIRQTLTKLIPEGPGRELITLKRDLKGHQDVLNIPMSDKMKGAIASVEQFFTELFKVGVEGDHFDPKSFRDNYISRLYGAKASKVMDYLNKKRPIDSKNPHSFRRVFEDLRAAAAEGYHPATLDIADLSEIYARSLHDTMLKSQLIKDVMKVLPDRLMYTAEKPSRKNWLPIDEFFTAARRQTGEFRKDGTPIEERLYADKDLHALISNALKPSMVREGVLAPIAKYNAAMKSVMLALDIYHMVNLGKSAAWSWTNPFAPGRGIEMFDPKNTKFETLQFIIKNSPLDFGRGDWGMPEYLRLMNQTPLRRMLADKYGAVYDKTFGLFSKYLWERYHRGIKAMVAVKEFERAILDPKKVNIPPEQIAYEVGKSVNNIFGGRGWSQTGRSKTFEDVSRGILLAPDWLETRLSIFGNALPLPESMTGVGAVQRGIAQRYLGMMMVTTGAFCATVNKVLQSIYPELKDHWVNKHPGGYVSIVTPFKDSAGHNLLLGMGGPYQYVFDLFNNMGRTMTNRESVIMRAATEFFTQRDWMDKKIAPSLWDKDNLVHLGGNLVPTPLILQMFKLEWDWQNVAQTKGLLDITRGLTRSMGFHPTTGYPIELRQKLNYLTDRREFVRGLARKLNDPHSQSVVGYADKIAQTKIREYNEDLERFIKECQNVYRGDEIAKRAAALVIK